jgi:hypothetical protein
MLATRTVRSAAMLLLLVAATSSSAQYDSRRTTIVWDAHRAATGETPSYMDTHIPLVRDASRDSDIIAIGTVDSTKAVKHGSRYYCAVYLRVERAFKSSCPGSTLYFLTRNAFVQGGDGHAMEVSMDDWPWIVANDRVLVVIRGDASGPHKSELPMCIYACFVPDGGTADSETVYEESGREFRDQDYRAAESAHAGTDPYTCLSICRRSFGTLGGVTELLGLSHKQDVRK